MQTEEILFAQAENYIDCSKPLKSEISTHCYEIKDPKSRMRRDKSITYSATTTNANNVRIRSDFHSGDLLAYKRIERSWPLVVSATVTVR
eukprot:IDg23319t1